jgi:hypothetical protein
MEDLNKRLKAAMEFIADQRLSYNKELLLLKSKCSLGSQIKYQGFRFMEVQYYDSTDLVDDNVRELINQKVAAMRESYENHLL